MRTAVICFALSAILLASCARREKPENVILMGKLAMSDIYEACPRFREMSKKYRPDENVVRRLREIDRQITFRVFLGTWCPDSEEHVPPFDILLRIVNNPQFEVEYYGVDRQKRDGLGLADQDTIEYVPTFVLVEGGRELGRIVEKPTVSIGEDILNILEGKD